MVSLNDLPSISAVFSAYASITAFIMLVQTMVNQLLPRTLQEYVISTLLNYFKPRTPTMTLIIEENTGMTRNQIYDDSETYLCTKSNANTDSLKITKSPKDKDVNLKFAQKETISDSFEGIELQWKFVCTESQWNGGSPGNDFNDGGGISKRPPARHFELRFDKKHKEKVLESYVPFVLKKAKMIREEKRVVKLHTLSHSRSYSGSSAWDSIYFEHPSTFDKLAMEPSLKRAVIDDLDRFVEREGYYRKVGKAWKRGYLLCGPPGTGKSSLVAAMANYLRFDVYDLQLSNITSDWSLRELLLSTTNKSILVIEDIDCSVELPERERERKLSHHNHGRGEYRPRDLQFSLAGLLNFIDGLWSSCGDERIIIFTTNNKDKLDPALLRPGRMDMHVYMSYLTTDGFRLLASNYLDIHSRHARFDEIEELIESMKVTPAEVAEELMKSDDADLSLGGLVDFLKQKKMESCKLKG